MASLFEQLASVERQYQEIETQLGNPDVASNPARLKEYGKRYRELGELYRAYQGYREILRTEEEARAILGSGADPELRELAEDELRQAVAARETAEIELQRLLLPKDPNDEKNVILEVRAGTGGEEAALFGQDLFRMYTRYAERQRWKVQVLSESTAEGGGLKEVIALVEGAGAYSRLKFESGTHRVQRVPETEASGRIHTSAATVAVLPEAEEVEIEIDPNDLRIDVFRAGGPGGQSVNTTDSAVRITHLPSGLVVSCQDEKSQLKNKGKALKILRARLLDQMQREQEDRISAERKSQVGSGDRSAKIRTYNYPQGRVTDHRAGVTVHQLPAILEGDLDGFLDEVSTVLLARQLEAQGA
jgi:peptide chain release factor 1